MLAVTAVARQPTKHGACSVKKNDQIADLDHESPVIIKKMILPDAAEARGGVVADVEVAVGQRSVLEAVAKVVTEVDIDEVEMIAKGAQIAVTVGQYVSYSHVVACSLK